MVSDNCMPSPPLRVTVKVTMDAPSFHPGSVVSATISLRARNYTPLQSSRSLRNSHAQRAPLSFSASIASSVLSTSPQSGVARAEYVIAELSGRWNSDRAWVVPDAHPQANPSVHLDNHAKTPISASALRTLNSSPLNSTSDPYPWSAALADANAIGGGGRSGHSGIIFRSQPLIVCEDEQIPAESQVSFSISAVLPDLIPPTLRGSSMRYVYALILVVKFPDDTLPRHVRVPFRVLATASSSLGRQIFTNHPIAVPTPRDVGPRPNRFLQSDDATALCMSCRMLKSAPPDDIELALALSMNGRLTGYSADVEHRRFADDIQNSLQPSSRKIALPLLRNGLSISPSLTDDNDFSHKSDGLCVYSVSRGPVHIARLFISKKVHYLGDSISIMFHFQPHSPCYRIGARLEVQEVVNAEFAFGHERTEAETAATLPSVGTGPSNEANDLFSYSHNSGDANTDDSMGIPRDGVVFRRDYGEYGEVVTAARNTEVTFSIPHDAPASFTTGVVTIRWIIHFVFTVSKSRLLENVSSEEDMREVREEEDHVSKSDGDKTSESRTKTANPFRNERGNGHVKRDDDGWRGGPWGGEDPRKWDHLPNAEVDVLKWTLPIVVSGQPGSQWGTRSEIEITHTSKS